MCPNECCAKLKFGGQLARVSKRNLKALGEGARWKAGVSPLRGRSPCKQTKHNGARGAGGRVVALLVAAVLSPAPRALKLFLWTSRGCERYALLPRPTSFRPHSWAHNSAGFACPTNRQMSEKAGACSKAVWIIQAFVKSLGHARDFFHFGAELSCKNHKAGYDEYCRKAAARCRICTERTNQTNRKR